MTSRYERSAFQLENNATVRVSLDTKLDLIAEHGYRDNRWGRDLINESMVADSEICHFPHAVLEIKLSLELGQEAPQWVQNLLKKDYIISCGKFSKFIHGCAVLLPRKVTLLPCWFPHLEQTSDFRADDRIIRQTSKSEFGKSRITSLRNSMTDIKIDMNSIQKSASKSVNDQKDVELVTFNPGNAGKGDLKDSKNSEKNQGKWNPRRFIPANLSSKIPFIRDKKRKMKKVQAPIKIEPKTFFANERTFIQWMSFLILIQGIGFGLLGLGIQVWLKVAGFLFIILSLVFMIYAIVLFLVRRHKIATRQRGPYDERVGPIMIVTLLMLGLLTTVILYATGFTVACKGYPLLSNSFFHYHPSEALWHPTKERVIIVGPDMITYIDPNTYSTENYVLAGDYEGVTLVPSRPGFLYVGMEWPATVVEWNEETHQVTRTIPMDIPGDAAEGLEGLAFVPIDGHPHGGLWWVGSQYDGRIYVFDVDLTDPQSTATQVDSFAPIPNLTHISALNYHPQSGLVFGVIARKWAFAITSDKQIQGSWPLGVGNPEGFCIVGSGPTYESYLACDACEDVWKFKFSFSSGIESGKCAGTSSLAPSSNSTNNYLSS